MEPQIQQENMPQDPNMQGELSTDELAAAMGFMGTLGEQQMQAEAPENNEEMAETDEMELEAEEQQDPEEMKKELKDEMLGEIKNELKSVIKDELRALLEEEE